MVLAIMAFRNNRCFWPLSDFREPLIVVVNYILQYVYIYFIFVSELHLYKGFVSLIAVCGGEERGPVQEWLKTMISMT